VVTGALGIDPDAEPKLADRLARLYSQGALQCTCDCAWPVCPRSDGMLSDATYNGGLTFSTRFVLPDPVRRLGGAEWTRMFRTRSDDHHSL
jgi:hypothetical protein